MGSRSRPAMPLTEQCHVMWEQDELVCVCVCVSAGLHVCMPVWVGGARGSYGRVVAQRYLDHCGSLGGIEARLQVYS